jgi:hypothetical protein
MHLHSAAVAHHPGSPEAAGTHATAALVALQPGPEVFAVHQLQTSPPHVGMLGQSVSNLPLTPHTACAGVVHVSDPAVLIIAIIARKLHFMAYLLRRGT